ncbi:PAS domain S-box protein (macronuclear) [Tetrahymena thermophila SB210]|uniref:PAS domain S-box protein n=1 Tax=Tetrahymena thermophila (strain SB210) TaxID=312017 RepID=W7X9D6_TETTS|nr:PAS domain S-box protein [Tetrahymena thermophila SB210]EWS72998.1 PAS domain S-box protein [Tetrahymena thermophila SB210]|eukprot:XP_012654466.1 PAS domain S-box protein [Tetrahymena thermophila SB210]
MIEVIVFDDKINVCNGKLRRALLQVGQFYDFLSGHFIDLYQVQNISIPLIILNEDLEQNFIELFQINAQDFDLQYLACIFTQILDFQNRKIKQFQEDAFDISQEKNSQQKRQNQIYQKAEKSCLLYMSLIEKEFIVKKTSKRFEKTFGFNSEFIQGKQLNTLIPNLLKKHHNLMIQSFISEQSMDIINLGERSVFGLDKKGFVFPISLRIKLQLLENDFGVCALIQKKQQIFSYIFFEDEGTITDFSKKIFLDIFQTLGFKAKKNIANKIDQNPNLVEIYEPQIQNNSLNQKTFQDINLFKNTENQSPKTYRASSELKFLSSKGILDKQSIEIQFQNYSRRIPTNPFEQPEIIFSPTILSNERQQVLINQTNEQKDFVFFPTQNIQSLNQNLQEISFNNASQQYFNKFIIKNNSNIIQNKNIDLQFLEEQSLSYELQNLNREKRKKYFQEQEEIKQELKNEIASVNSSKYSTEEILKKKMIQRIKKAKFTNGLQLITFTGVGAFAILSIVSLIIYIQNLKSLDSFVQSFLKIDGAIFCFIDVMNLVGLNNYQSVLGYSQSLIIDSLDLQNYEYNQTDFQQQRTLQDYNLNLQKLVLNNDSGDQLDELQKNMFQVQIYAAGFYNNARAQQNSTTTFEQSLQYTLMEFFYEIVFYYINYEEQQEDFIWGNIYNFKQRMKNLQQIVENYAQEEFNNMNLYQTFAIALFATISAVLVFSILPLNILIQSEKEKILKLFGTFSPSTMESQIEQIELGLYKIEQFNALEQTNNNNSFKQAQNQQKQIQQIKNLNLNQNFLSEQAQKYENSQNNYVPKYIQRQLDRRSRQIASFSSIKKFNLALFLFGIVAVVLLLVMPILNFVVFNPFEAESKVTLKDRISLIDVYSLTIENFCTHMEQIYLIFIGTPPSTSYYQTYLQNLQNNNQQSFQNLQDLTIDLDIKRNNQGLYVDFYQNLLNSNVCQVRQNYPQYFNSNITETDCNNIFNGILQRGLIFSVQKVFQTFQELYQIYQIQDINEVTNQLIYFQTQYSLIQLKQLIQIISEAVNGIRQYQNDQLQSYENQVKQNLLMGIPLLLVQRLTSKRNKNFQIVPHKSSV